VIELKDAKLPDVKAMAGMKAVVHLDLSTNLLSAMPILKDQKFLQVKIRVAVYG